MEAYYGDRICSVLNQVETHPHQVVLKQWEELLTEMYGERVPPTFFDEMMNDDNINQAAKNWLIKYISEINHAK